MDLEVENLNGTQPLLELIKPLLFLLIHVKIFVVKKKRNLVEKCALVNPTGLVTICWLNWAALHF